MSIGVLGSERADEEALKVAQEVGRGIAEKGAILICGGRRGVMEAAAKGCREAMGISIGILPSLDKSEGNEYLDIVIPTSMGYGRNILVASASDVVIAVDGHYGTLSEAAFALNYGRPVVVIVGTGGTADFLAGGPYDVHEATDAKEAVDKAIRLAKSRKK
ncbi:MAG: TIGR00725 family protein [Candidatus Altiarchaeota archaeon]|nr:TIGR00725 family protein [Candidatus Altiarchaeota archaeon]